MTKPSSLNHNKWLVTLVAVEKAFDLEAVQLSEGNFTHSELTFMDDNYVILYQKTK